MCTFLSHGAICAELEFAGGHGCWLLHRCQRYAPVREVLTDGDTGVLVDFFSPEHQANAIEALLDSEDLRRSLADAARPGQRRLRLQRGFAGLDGAHVCKQ